MKTIKVDITIPEGDYCYELQGDIITIGTVCLFRSGGFCEIFKEYTQGNYKDMKCPKCREIGYFNKESEK